ncbi:aldo/keto reductase, partial [Streptomyces sp. NPDC005879]|uniref:aldo/keto reductase n=2 Tax=unclassified Streptomyces TaxID=2593676 RepID=UPI0033C742F2
MTTTNDSDTSAAEASAAVAGHYRIGGELTVRRMGFGAMRLPAAQWDGPAHDPVRSVAVLRRAAELGVNHIDTAAFYFFEDIAANDLIRTALHPYPDDLVIATKVGPGRLPDGSWTDPAGPAELRAAVHRNLRELGRDHLDLVYLRFLRTDGPGEDRFATLAALRDEGLVRHLGPVRRIRSHPGGPRVFVLVSGVWRVEMQGGG